MIAIYDALVPYVAYLALILRVWVGANLVIHSRPKLGKAGAGHATGAAQSFGAPPHMGHAATALELVGGIALIVGFLVPVVAVLMMLQFGILAILKKVRMHMQYIAPGKPSYEIDILYFMFGLVLLVIGSGVLSIDRLIGI